MTALPLRDFTDAERATLEAIEAAPAVSESVQRRLLQALFFADAPWMPAEEFDAGTTDPRVKARFDTLADAALAVLSGPSSDAERAVERVLALADELEAEAAADLARALTVEDQGFGAGMGYAVDRIRAAVAGES